MTDYKDVIAKAKVKDIDSFRAKMDTLHAFLCEYNEKVNLTRITEYNDYIQKHVCDSLLLGAACQELTEKKLKINILEKL